MVKAIVDISDRSNRVLNVIKAKYGLRDKSQAIDMMSEQYESQLLEPELRPEYIAKAQKIMKQKKIDVGTVENLRKRLQM
ncbi:MAG TPA: DUF2683 family protein [Candidatus Nanoarchaeia archaeon]|nr:DUF2683 family protein [Candidatus Nanoarchaeia archaeon]